MLLNKSWHSSCWLWSKQFLHDLSFWLSAGDELIAGSWLVNWEPFSPLIGCQLSLNLFDFLIRITNKIALLILHKKWTSKESVKCQFFSPIGGLQLRRSANEALHEIQISDFSKIQSRINLIAESTLMNLIHLNYSRHCLGTGSITAWKS